ncbi:MAG: DUF1570 domain-containing protein [Planctomycetota bacterium]
MKLLPSPARCRRLALLLCVLGMAFGFYLWRRWWRPKLTVTTRHYVIRSTCPRQQAEQAGRALEALYGAYVEFFADLPGVTQEHNRLRVCLYRDRDEFRRYNPHAGWAEAFYRQGRCHAYYGTWEGNPSHWLLHEATHQLNSEVAGLDVAEWVSEGLATFFGASQYEGDVLEVGRVDPDTYPVWWLRDMELSGDLEADVQSGVVIPLRGIVSGHGGPDIDEEFNRYYIHWWSLTHFLMEHEGGRRRSGYFRVIREGGTLEAFEKHVGPVGQVQGPWHEYLYEVHKRALAGELPVPAEEPTARPSR